MAAHAERMTDLVERDAFDLIGQQQPVLVGDVEPDVANLVLDVEAPLGIAAQHAARVSDGGGAVDAHVRAGLGGALAEQPDLEVRLGRARSPARSAPPRRGRAARSRAPPGPTARSAPARGGLGLLVEAVEAARRLDPDGERHVLGPPVTEHEPALAFGREPEPLREPRPRALRAGRHLVHHERQVVRLVQPGVRVAEGEVVVAVVQIRRRRFRVAGAGEREPEPGARRERQPGRPRRAHRRRRRARSISRSCSRFFTTSRRSTCLRPRTSPSSTFARPSFQ